MSMRYQAGIVLPGYNALKVANAPTIGAATSPSSTTASVVFTAPACVGGGAISSYTAFANCGLLTASGASSPLTVTGLTTGTTYTFKVIATNVFGPSYPSAASNSVTPVAQGQDAYITAGTYSWVAPAGVTSASIVAVGGGGANASSGGNSSFNSTTVIGYGGLRYASGGTGGSYSGGGGGNGGSTGDSATGGGGAGGYAGNGGNGGGIGSNGTSGSGGGGGGGGGGRYGYSGGGGGGVGILGQGSNGVGGSGTTSCSGPGGGGGGGGSSGTTGSTGALCGDGGGGAYGGGSGNSSGGGGGGGGLGYTNNFTVTPGNSYTVVVGSSTGGSGAVRIIYPGTTRSFPSTNTGNL